MNKIILTLALLILLPIASAITLTSVDYVKLSPGTESAISLVIKNTIGSDATDLSISLDARGIPITIVGSSEETIEELDENKKEEFTFIVRASNDAKPGDYQIPYTISYEDENSSTRKTKTGVIGITIGSNPDISLSLTAETPVINNKGVINIKVVNKGFADAKFAFLKIYPEGYTLFSEEEIYIGTISSDDFETASFDVKFTSKNPTFIATFEYKDFENNLKKETIEIPIKIYSEEEAISLGIIEKSNLPLYISIIVILIVIWIAWRIIAKRIRLRKSKIKAKE